MSPRATSAITNLTAGEFSPKLAGRYDIAKHANAAKKIENFLILNAGGGTRRPGTKFAGEVKDSSKATLIMEFVFSTDQTYIIEMGDIYMRFYSNEARVVEADVTMTGATALNPVEITAAGHGYTDGDWVTISGVVGMTELNGKMFVVANSGATFTLKDVDGTDIDGTGFSAYVSGGIVNKVFEIVSPYLEAELFDLQFAQSADILYITHVNHAPRQLERLTASSFQLNLFAFVGGPFLEDNVSAVTLTPSADAGAAITVTASVATFNANHVGSIWKIKSGRVKITVFGSTTSVTADVMINEDGTAGGLATGPAATTDWAEGAWSADEGYPGSVSFHEQRLLFGRTTNSPQTFWGSQVVEFTNFFPGVDASDSYTYKIATEQVNAIRWLSSGPKALQIGTFGGTFSASSGNLNEPITPTNIVVQRDTTYGAAAILPRRIGSFVYYIQRSLTTLRELGFNFDIDSQQALDMTLLSDHILSNGVVDMAYQQSPNNILWVVRSDGELAALTRQIPQEVIGWSRSIMGGAFQGGIAKVESVAVIPGLTGNDQVWVIVKRTINSITRRYVEFLEDQDFDELDDAFFVDSGLSLDNAKTITVATQTSPVVVTSALHGFSNGDQIKIVDVVGMTELNGLFYKVKEVAANTFKLTNTADVDIDGTAFTAYITGGEAREMVTAISGLDHLEGESVQVLVDGAVHPNETVASGAITLDLRAAKVHVGLGYVSDVQGLKLSEGSAVGTGQARDRRIYIATFRFYKTLGAKFGREDNLETMIFRKTSDPLDRPPPMFTGDKRVQFPMGWDRAGEYFLRQDQPLPMTILSVLLNSIVNDK